MAKFKNEKKNYKKWKKSVICSGSKNLVPKDTNNTACGNTVDINASYIREFNSHYGFICPFCNSFTEIPANEIPLRIRIKAISIS